MKVGKSAYYIIGLRRGGIHAILNWVSYNLGGWTVVVDDIKPDYGYPYGHYSMRDGVSVPNGLCDSYDHFVCDTQDRCDPAHILEYLESPQREGFFDGTPPGQSFVAYVLRDPFNWIASRLKLFTKEGAEYHNRKEPGCIERWKRMADMYLGGRVRTANGVVEAVVLYDRWFSDTDYRREMADVLGLPQYHKGVNKVGQGGGGSSFDGVSYDGRAAKMDVLNRWTRYASDPDFTELFIRDKGIRERFEGIYGRGALVERMRVIDPSNDEWKV